MVGETEGTRGVLGPFDKPRIKSPGCLVVVFRGTTKSLNGGGGGFGFHNNNKSKRDLRWSWYDGVGHKRRKQLRLVWVFMHLEISKEGERIHLFLVGRVNAEYYWVSKGFSIVVTASSGRREYW